SRERGPHGLPVGQSGNPATGLGGTVSVRRRLDLGSYLGRERRREPKARCGWLDAAAARVFEHRGRRFPLRHRRRTEDPLGYWAARTGLLPGRSLRSEERRVGKECRSWWSAYD